MKLSALASVTAVLLLILGAANTASGAGLLWGRSDLVTSKLGAGMHAHRIGRAESIEEKVKLFASLAPVMGVVFLLFGLASLTGGVLVLLSRPWAHWLGALSMGGFAAVTASFGLLFHFGPFTLFLILLYLFTGVASLYSRPD